MYAAQGPVPLQTLFETGDNALLRACYAKMTKQGHKLVEVSAGLDIAVFYRSNIVTVVVFGTPEQ